MSELKVLLGCQINKVTIDDKLEWTHWTKRLLSNIIRKYNINYENIIIHTIDINIKANPIADGRVIEKFKKIISGKTYEEVLQNIETSPFKIPDHISYPDILCDLFSSEFIDSNKDKYDIVILPDCDGVYITIQDEKNNDEFLILVNNLTALLKNGGLLFLSKFVGNNKDILMDLIIKKFIKPYFNTEYYNDNIFDDNNKAIIIKKL